MLYSPESQFLESESDKSDNVDSKEEYSDGLYSTDVMIMKHHKKAGNKRFNRGRKFHIKSISSASKRYDVGNSKKDDGKCFNYGGTDQFFHDCKIKKNIPKDESYEAKYKHLVASLKMNNLESKLLVAEEDEESLVKEVKKDVCLTAATDEFFIDKNGNNSCTFDVDLAKAASDLKF